MTEEELHREMHDWLNDPRWMLLKDDSEKEDQHLLGDEKDDDD